MTVERFQVLMDNNIKGNKIFFVLIPYRLLASSSLLGAHEFCCFNLVFTSEAFYRPRL